MRDQTDTLTQSYVGAKEDCVCAQASVFTPPLKRYSLHLGPRAGLCRGSHCTGPTGLHNLCMCNVHVLQLGFRRILKVTSLRARFESDQGYKVCKIISRGMQGKSGYNRFGIGYDSCGDNGGMA